MARARAGCRRLHFCAVAERDNLLLDARLITKFCRVVPSCVPEFVDRET